MSQGYDGKTSPLQASVSDRLNFHQRMNFPNSLPRHILATVALIFGSVIDVPKCFSDNGDDRWITDRTALGKDCPVSILLDDYDGMLDTRDLRVSEQRPK